MHFITHAHCNGNPPRQLAGITYFNRNTLLAAMMRNREAVRYLVAPTGFGKTFLAYSYANLINEFNDTVWIDACHPCFLRDLDAQTLLSDVMDSTKEGTLIIFDDVPSLGSVRSTAFSECCFELVAMQREVVVCATPVSHPLRNYEESCLCIRPMEFLYDETELKTARSLLATNPYVPQDNTLIFRIPHLAMHELQSFETFLRNHIADLDNSFQCALSFGMVLLERGTYDDLEAVVSRELSIEELGEYTMRPFVQFDNAAREFAVTGFPFQEILRAFSPQMTNMAWAVGCEAATEFALQLASLMLEKGKADRAVQLLMNACDPQTRFRWLEDNQAFMLDTCALCAAEKLYESLRSERWRSAPSLYTASCIRRVFIDYSEKAVKDLLHIVSKVEYTLDLRLEAASYAYLFTKPDQFEQEVGSTIFAQSASLRREAKVLDDAHRELWAFWSAVGKEDVRYEKICNSLKGGKYAPLVVALCLHRLMSSGVRTAALRNMQETVDSVFLNPDFCTEGRSALTILRREVRLAGLFLDCTISSIAKSYDSCELFENELEIQSSTYARSKAAKTSALTSAFTSQIVHVRHRSDTVDIPLLNVRLFGNFDVNIGGLPVVEKEFKRQKVRTLLAILVLDAGRELSCENLGKRMWPDSNSSSARHNLYNIVSILRRSLSLADGSCPYLHRPHGVVCLDQSLLSSDVEKLDTVCKRLRFDDPDHDTCLYLLEQAKDLYRGELLPAERDEPMILASREEWRNKLVNTLLLAAKRMLGIGDDAVALQLAQQALAYNPQREDSYEQLMSMQARCGQRPAAIETWMRYRTFLTEELGLDPSKRITNLYQQIISE